MKINKPLIFPMILLLVSVAAAYTIDGEISSIKNPEMSSSLYQIESSIDKPEVITASSHIYEIEAYVLDEIIAQQYYYLPGDANMAAESWPAQTIGGDVTYLINYFRGLADPCKFDGFYASADANGDCLVVGGDVTSLVNYFRGLADLSYCADYQPSWPTFSDVPTETPDNWPNCDSNVLSDDNVVDVNSLEKAVAK